MERSICLNDYFKAIFFFNFFNSLPLIIIVKIGCLMIRCYHDLAVFLGDADSPQFHKYLISDGRRGLNKPLPVAVRAWLAQYSFEAFSHPFSGHLNKTQFGYFQYCTFCPVIDHGFLKHRKEFMPVLLFFHINKINYDNSAEITQAYLVRYFFHGLYIGFKYCLCIDVAMRFMRKNISEDIKIIV